MTFSYDLLKSQAVKRLCWHPLIDVVWAKSWEIDLSCFWLNLALLLCCEFKETAGDSLSQDVVLSRPWYLNLIEDAE